MAGAEDVSLIRRISAFGLVPFLSVVSMLVVLPVIAAATDAAGWAAIAIGQSIGGLAGIVVAYGWTMVGPVEIVREPAETGVTYFESLLSRGVVFLFTLAPMALISLAAAPTGHVALTLFVAVASASIGLSSNWVAVGIGRARGVVLLELLPRVALLVLAAVVIGAGGSLYWYPIAILSASLIGLALYAAFVVRPVRSTSTVVATVRRRLVDNLSAVATSFAGGAYSAAALLLVGLVTSVHQTAMMASADRLYRAGLFSITALNSGLQAWVVHPDPAVARERQRSALLIHTGFGLVGMVSFACLAPTAARLLFGEDLAPGFLVTLGYAVAFGALAPATSLAQHILVPAKRVDAIMRTTLMGATVGVPAVLVLAHEFGAAGAAAALAASEILVLCSLAWSVTRRSSAQPVND